MYDPTFVYTKYSFLFLKHFRIKQNKAELRKQKVAVSSVAVATTFLFGMVDSDVGTDKFSLVLRTSHVCGHAHV